MDDSLTIRPHPETESMTVGEIREGIADAEKSMRYARELKNSELETWFSQEIRLLEAGLARRNGVKPPFETERHRSAWDPHPDYGTYSDARLELEQALLDQRIGWAGEDQEPVLATYLEQRMRLLHAERARRNGHNFTSDHRNPSSEVKFEREINAAVLQAEATAQGIPPVTYKPFLGRDGYVVKGWSHLLAAFPKTGKTEVMVRALADWPDDKVLYVTEEPKSVWQARLLNLPATFNHVSLFFGLGVQPGEIFERIKGGDETVFILDTIRNLLGLADETDNSAMARALIPYIAVAREQEKTIFLLHHDRKGGGEHGEGIAGAHAFLAVVDIALEIKRDGPEDSRRRLLRGWGRVVEIPRVIYELQDDGSMVALGSPALITLGEVKNRVWSVLDDEFEKTKSIRGHIDDPKPSEDQVLKALDELAQEGKAERDPPFSEGKRQGARYRWRRSQNLTSDGPLLKTEVKLETNSDILESVL